MRQLRLIPVLLAGALAACSGELVVPAAPATTTLSPPPGPFSDKVTVTLTTDKPATIFFTVDGSDPRIDGPARTKGASPQTVELTKTTTLTFYSRTAEDAEEYVHSVQYYRAGGVKGSVKGVIVVDTIAVGKPIAVTIDGSQQVFPAINAKGEIPFTFAPLATGAHRLQAIADRDLDGNFFPFTDTTSDPYDFQLDTSDPFRASVEGVRLLLGASPAGLCTISGTITVPKAANGQIVRISALGGNALTPGGDFTGVLSQLLDGDQLFAREGTTEYPYAITGLEPGSYIPVPVITSLGLGGIALNLLVNPLQPVACGAGQVIVKDFKFGSVGLSGTVAWTPVPPTDGSTPPPFAYGIVAARNFGLLDGAQVVLMPVLFVGATPTLTGNYAGVGLRDNVKFALKAFLPAGASQPIADALQWAIDVTSPGDRVVQVATADVVQDFTLP